MATRVAVVLYLCVSSTACLRASSSTSNAPDGNAGELEAGGLPRPDTGRSDSSLGAADMALDGASPPDLSPAATITGLVELKENPLMLFTCSPSTTDKDCNGPLFVGAYDSTNHKFSPAKLLASTRSSGPVDMNGGKTFAYTLSGLKGGQKVFLSAILKDTALTMPTPAVPLTNDVYSIATIAPSVTPQAGQTVKDFTLTLTFRCVLTSCGSTQ